METAAISCLVLECGKLTTFPTLPFWVIVIELTSSRNPRGGQELCAHFVTHGSVQSMNGNLDQNRWHPHLREMQRTAAATFRAYQSPFPQLGRCFSHLRALEMLI